MGVSELEPVQVAQQHVNKLRIVTTVGIVPTVRSQLTTYDIEQIARYAGTADDVSNWLFADLLAEIEQRIFRTVPPAERIERRDRAWLQIAAVYGRDVTPATMLNMRATANAFPYDRRRHNQAVRFSHHKVLVPYEDEQQDAYLDMVEDYGWSVRRLEAELYGSKNRTQVITMTLTGDMRVTIGDALDAWVREPGLSWIDRTDREQRRKAVVEWLIEQETNDEARPHTERS